MLRAGHANDVSLLKRYGWVRDTVRMLDDAKQLTHGEAFVMRWMSGVVRAQLPGFFGEREHAVARAQRRTRLRPTAFATKSPLLAAIAGVAWLAAASMESVLAHLEELVAERTDHLNKTVARLTEATETITAAHPVAQPPADTDGPRFILGERVGSPGG